MNHVRIIHPGELDAGLEARWLEIAAGRGALASPYFRPEFTRLIGRLRPGTRVAVLEDGGRVVGFFPYEARGFGRGQPVGGALSDHHGPIAEAGVRIPPAELLRSCGLSVWEFDHLSGEHPFDGIDARACSSPIIDLSGGYQAYVEERRAAGSEQIKKNGTLARKLEREHGPAELRVHDERPEALALLMGWKSEQCRASGAADVFGVPWTRLLLRELMSAQAPGFAGLLSTLSVRGRVIAAHLGMRSSSVWHYWFPSYDHEFARYSPGLILLLRMAEAASSLGLGSIDLGKGDSFYKGRLANAAIPLVEGRLEVPSPVNALRSAWRRAEAWTDSGTIGRVLGLPVRALRRWRRGRKYV